MKDVNRQTAVICGSATPIGRALVNRLRAAGWEIATIDPAETASHSDAKVTLQGDLSRSDLWEMLQASLLEHDLSPSLFVHALSGFDRPAASPWSNKVEDSYAALVRSAGLGSETLMPLMPAEQAAIVFVASVLAGWDVKADTASYAASQAGLLALIRSLALSGGPSGSRANAVCIGLVEDPGAPHEAVPAGLQERIPLGSPASPEDVVDAILFLASGDARHVSGSALVIDGGQSLQSWSNAPRAASYRPAVPARRAEFDPERRFAGRTVVITGASGGLGSAAAHRFAAEGAHLALLDRDGPAVAALAKHLSAGFDGAALAIEVDVSDETAMAAAFARAEERFGHLDVLFNNAGIGSRNLTIEEMSPEHWDEVIAINLRGIFLGCKYGVPALSRAGGGAIVNMGSSTGRHDTITGGAAYMASKAAVEALTKSLALQVAPHGIRANTICPGIIQTRLSFRQQERGDPESYFVEFAARIPLGRVGQPEDVAAAVAFLASDQARHITGASLLIDGGQTMRRWVSAPDLSGPSTA